jgi:parvulin-like peptidyl-prolyl isomerase
VLATLALSGCGSSGGAASHPEPQAVTPADFATAPGEQSAANPVSPSPATNTPPPRASDAPPSDVVVVAGAPETPPPSAGPVRAARERELQVDQLVGQINGRPVYADEFFEPMDERFTREAARKNDREFIAFARKEIEAALWDKLRDELLLSEFQGAMTPEQRMGVLAFIDDVRRDLLSGNLGSEALASQRLREAEGLGLEEKVQDITERRFILEQLRRAIGNRVTVSAADVRLYYEQNIDEFVPPPVAKFTIVRVPAADASKLGAIEAAFASGTAFDEIARQYSTWQPDKANGHEVTVKGGLYSAATLFGPAPLNDAAKALGVGQTTPRVEFKGDAYWIRLNTIEQQPGRSLYDAQEQIERKLRSERSREEEVRYFEQLFRRGSFSDVKEMVRRLLEFAGERYLIQKPRDAKPEATKPEPEK